LVNEADIDAALDRQRIEGGDLADNLVALGRLSEAQLANVKDAAPPVPAGLEATGISSRNLLGLLLKFMHVEGCETQLDFAERLKLPRRLIQELLNEAVQLRLVEAIGAADSLALTLRFALSEAGRTAAREALDGSQYLGPAPVPLAIYQEQLKKQRIANEALDIEALRKGFDGLVVPDQYLRKMLPAINAGRSVLIYGPPGNGKTTLSTRISKLFREEVYIPYAIEAGGQIIKIFDHGLHEPIEPVGEQHVASAIGLRRDEYDQRWVACRRPVAMAGGEMTLDMLDLKYSAATGFYDAPLHVKAFNGMFLIDDFGRQSFRPDDLLNRWIVPMESQIDFLKLHTGASFELPFDVLLVFSTNLSPADLMDGAFMRRIQYKIKLYSPTRTEYRQIFDGVAKSRGLTVTDTVFDFIVDSLNKGQFELAYYQPRFICDQVIEACKSFREEPQLTRERVAEALSNLYFDIEVSLDDAAAPVGLAA
jgi:predicted ATPase with chaperone activity